MSKTAIAANYFEMYFNFQADIFNPINANNLFFY